MNIHSPARPLRFLSLLLALVLAGCFGGGGDSGRAEIRVLNLSTGYTSIDLYSQSDEAEEQQFSGVALGSVSAYSTLKGDTYTLKLRRSGTTGDLLSWSATLADDTHSTIVAYGDTNQFAALVIDDDIEVPASGYTKVQVLNTTSSESFDVYLTGTDDLLDDVAATVSGVAAGAQSSAATVSSGTRRLRVTASGSKTDLRLNVPEVTLASGGVLSIILVESSGGILVNAVLLPQQGSPSTYDNTESAQIRVLNVSNGYDPIDVYSAPSDGSTETGLFSGIGLGSITSYASVKADTYTLKFRKAGAVGNLLSLGATLIEDKHVTYVAHGALNRFAVTAIDEETEVPGSGYTKLRVLNATALDSLDVYLTGSGDSLSDVSPVVGTAVAGSLADVVTVASGTYRLRVTGNGSKADLRLDVPAIALESRGVITVVLTEASGGVLVDAVVLPQQSEPVTYVNGSVRIRGAVGLSTGATVSVSVAGTSIVTRRSARSYIPDAYTLLETNGEAASIVVNVDDAVVASGTATLASGQDYTLLVWDRDGVTQLTLVADDNLPPAGTFAKLRLVNAMSGLGAPLTLAVNYSPVAEYVETGTASDPAEIMAGTAYRLDVSNALTIATVLAREDVTLQSSGVYTLLLAGGGSSAVVGTLRKDR